MTAVFLTSAAADAAVTVGPGTKWKAGWAPGASTRLLNKNTSAAPASALQVTDSATAGTDGTALSFYTEPLWGVTIAGQIILTCWTKEAATTNNVAPSIRIERCSGDGTVLSTIVSENTNQGAGEMPTTAGGATDSITMTAANVTDTTLSDGDRLRITLYIDNAVDQGGTGSMASGGNAQFWVNGPNGASGQSQINFTEVVQPQAGPRLVTSPETSWTTTTTPKTLTAVGALSGDLVVALAGGDNFSTPATAVAFSTTVGTTGAWTKILEALVGNTASPWKSNARADVTADGDVTASIDRTQSSAQIWGAWLAHIRNHGGVGNTAELVDSTSDTVSLTVSEGSMVLALGIDWDHVTPTTVFTPSGAHDIERNAGLTAVTWYAGLWVGQAAGTRNYGIATNSSANFSLTVIEILAPSGSTPVGKDLQLMWNTRAALGDPLQLLWNTRAAIGDEFQALWNVRIPVGKPVQALWNTRQAVGDPLSLLWNTRQAVGDSLQLVWNTLTGVPVGKDLSLLWNTRAAVGDNAQFVWDTRAAIGDPLSLLWNTRTFVGDEVSLLWNTRAAVGDPLQLLWNVRVPVGDPLQLLWNVRAAVGDPIQFLWNTKASAGKNLQLVWNVEIIGASAIGKSLALVWNTKQAIGDPLDLRWNVRTPVSDELTLRWNTRALAAATVDLRWGIRTTVGKSGVYLWSVHSVAGRDLILLWDVESAPYDPIIDPFVVVLPNPAIGTIRRNAAQSDMQTKATIRTRPNNAEAKPQ